MFVGQRCEMNFKLQMYWTDIRDYSKVRAKSFSASQRVGLFAKLFRITCRQPRPCGNGTVADMIGLERLVHWRGAGPCIWSHDRTKKVG